MGKTTNGIVAEKNNQHTKNKFWRGSPDEEWEKKAKKAYETISKRAVKY